MNSRWSVEAGQAVVAPVAPSAEVPRVSAAAPEPSTSIRDAQISAGALWRGWRLRLLLLAALAGCLAVLTLANWVGEQPRIDARWRTDAASRIELVSSKDPSLRPFIGRRLLAIVTSEDRIEFDGTAALQAAPRWAVSDASRNRLVSLHDRLHKAFSAASVSLEFDSGESLTATPRAPGFASSSIGFWLTCSALLMLYMVAVSVLLANPQPHTLLFALIAMCQAANMGFLAVETAQQWGFPPTLNRFDAAWRSSFDLLTAAAVVHVTSIHPRRLPRSNLLAGAAWTVALLTSAALFADLLPQAWWWSQLTVALLAASALVLLTWSHHIEAHPYSLLLRTVGAMALTAWLTLSGIAILADRLPNLHIHFQAIGPRLWSMVFISLLLLVPFLAHTRVALREFALVAGVSTFAAIFDLILVGFFAFGPLGSVTVTFFVSIGLYAGARHWLLDYLLGQRTLTTERMFEQLYRIAREVETHPERAPSLLMQLLQELFEPLEAGTVPAIAGEVAVVKAGGSAMLVPADLADADIDEPGNSIVLRFAQRGRRLFNAEDARLAGRIVEQLRRAIAFDRAVEHGRVEERQRLAQDLHDDIGARLLTLMYQSTSLETEEYVRHTLQDLKTLTRGLSTSDHQLANAAAEWKTDLQQRLSAAGIILSWECDYDRDVTLSVVQWSALTRILRELVSNAIAHAKASRVEITLHLSYSKLELRVSDNGMGHQPEKWAHGLGLGGVRKRAKQLGGEVTWLQLRPNGICCVVGINGFELQP
ncbi:MAG: ATP-binding protein [Ideonella sp.]